MRRLLPVLLGATLLLAGCGDDGDDDRERAAATSIPDDTTSTTTTTEPPVPPPDVIPTDVSLITEEYVEQVLDDLFEVDLEAVRLTQANGAVNQPTIDLLGATSSDGVLTQRINDLIDLAASRFEGMEVNPRPMTFDVLRVIEANRSCIMSEVKADSTGIFPQSGLPDGAREFVRLFSANVEQLESGANPTAWVVDEFPVTLDGSGTPLTCP